MFLIMFVVLLAAPSLLLLLAAAALPSLHLFVAGLIMTVISAIFYAATKDGRIDRARGSNKAAQAASSDRS
jgi:ABC-type dipeptide/oligopeptide/nickel transport system permease subunit